MKIQTKSLSSKYDCLAPDGSEIRLLLSLKGGGLCHCTLIPGKTSVAVRHKTVEEMWYFLEGRGEVWRKQGKVEKVTRVKPGLCLTIPTGTHFQFRNTGNVPLRFVIVTMPPWPGAQEAVPVEGKW